MAAVSEEFRTIQKTSTSAGVKPTIPASSDHTDATWIATDIYEFELFFNSADNKLYTRVGSDIIEIRKDEQILTGMGFTPNGGADARSYDSEGGTYYHKGVLYTHGAGTNDIAVDDGDAVNPRYDAVYIDETNVPSVAKGTAAVTPVVPSLPNTTDILLGYIYVPALYVAGTALVQTIVREQSVNTIEDQVPEWQVDKTYHKFQIVQDSGNMYLALTTHVSTGIVADLAAGDLSEVGAGASIVTRSNYVIAKVKGDLPAPAAGVITLTSDVDVNGIIDITTDKIDLNGFSMRGFNPYNDGILYTGTAEMFTGTSEGLVANLKLTASAVGGEVFNVSDVGKTKLLNIYNCHFDGSDGLGTITGYYITSLVECVFTNNTNGITFTDNNHVFVSHTSWMSSNSNDFMTFTGTTIVIGIIGGHLHPLASKSATGIDISGIVSLGRGSIHALVLSGNGTFSNGTFGTEWSIDADGIQPQSDEQAVGGLHISAAVQTVIALVNTAVKVLGTTTTFGLFRVDDDGGTNNRLKYLGSGDRSFHVTADLTFISASNNKVWEFGIYKNGLKLNTNEMQITKANKTDLTHLSLSSVIDMSQNDYVELWVANLTDSTNLTVQKMNLSIS